MRDVSELWAALARRQEQRDRWILAMEDGSLTPAIILEILRETDLSNCREYFTDAKFFKLKKALGELKDTLGSVPDGHEFLVSPLGLTLKLKPKKKLSSRRSDDEELAELVRDAL